MKQELKPCPFCGNTNPLVYEEPIDDKFSEWIVECDNHYCPCNPVAHDTYQSEEEAIQAWNKRAGEEKIGCAMERQDNGSEIEPDWVFCSHCGDVVIRSWLCPNYCPNCGAEVVIDKSASLQFEVG